MGDVLMTTAQLPGIKRKRPASTIWWITLKNAAPLLYNNRFIDNVLTYDVESLSILSQMKFDYVLNVDKSKRSCAILNSVNGRKKLGFGLNKNGQIVPVNVGAQYNYNLGMDDHLKFKVNQRTGQDYLAETFRLQYNKDEYIFDFTNDELKFIEDYKKKVKLKKTDFIVYY